MKKYGYSYKKHKKDMNAMKYWCDCWLCWPEKKATKTAVRAKSKLEIKKELKKI